MPCIYQSRREAMRHIYRASVVWIIIGVAYVILPLPDQWWKDPFNAVMVGIGMLLVFTSGVVWEKRS